MYHYAGNNPIRYIDPDGRKIFDARWWHRNWDNLISLGINVSETITGIGIATTTGISGAGLFYGSLMAWHGGLNTTVSILKIAYTTTVAEIYGDDYADKEDSRLPDTILGFTAYLLGSLSEAIAGCSNTDFSEKLGAFFDLVDTASGIAISMNLGKCNKEIYNYINDVGRYISKENLLKLSKYLERAEKYKALEMVKGIIEKYDTISGVKGNLEQLVE